MSLPKHLCLSCLLNVVWTFWAISNKPDQKFPKVLWKQVAEWDALRSHPGEWQQVAEWGTGSPVLSFGGIPLWEHNDANPPHLTPSQVSPWLAMGWRFEEKQPSVSPLTTPLTWYFLFLHCHNLLPGLCSSLSVTACFQFSVSLNKTV